MKSIQQLTNEQIRKASLLRRSRPAPPAPSLPLPLVTVSRQYYAGGEFVARAVADALDFEFWDHEILTRIAEESGAIEPVLASFDERVQSPISDFLGSLLIGIEYSQGEYLRMLTKVVGAIVRRGAAVIVGRASHLLVDPQRALRVRVICPEEERVARLMSDKNLDESAARHMLRQEDRALRSFVHHHFRRDISNPEDFDIVVNTALLGNSEAAALAVTAYRRRFAAALERTASDTASQS